MCQFSPQSFSYPPLTHSPIYCIHGTKRNLTRSLNSYKGTYFVFLNFPHFSLHTPSHILPHSKIIHSPLLFIAAVTKLFSLRTCIHSHTHAALGTRQTTTITVHVEVFTLQRKRVYYPRASEINARQTKTAII